MMVGENEESDDENAFSNKPVWARILVIAAGPFFNFILALIFSVILINFCGYDDTMLLGKQGGICKTRHMRSILQFSVIL